MSFSNDLIPFNFCSVTLWPDNTEVDTGNGYYYPIGSMVLKHGCVFYMFYDAYYSGDTEVSSSLKSFQSANELESGRHIVTL